MFHAEHCPDGGEKHGVSWQADEGRRGTIRRAQAVDSVLQPILGNVAVDERIVRNPGNPEKEDQPQRERGQRRENEESAVFAHQFAHRVNISASPAHNSVGDDGILVEVTV